MFYGFNWRVEYHSWPCPAHDSTDLFSLLGRITMSRAVLADCLLLAILAMVEAATSELCQMLILIRHCVLFKMMTAIELYHLADGLLLSFNPCHSILCHFISSPSLSYCLRLPVGGAVRVIFTTAVRSRLRAMASSKAFMCLGRKRWQIALRASIFSS